MHYDEFNAGESDVNCNSYMSVMSSDESDDEDRQTVVTA